MNINKYITFSIMAICSNGFSQSPTYTNQDVSSPTIYYVKGDAIGRNNGSSWKNAFISIQDAVNAAKKGDKIWVAKGVYKPNSVLNSTTNQKSSFLMYKTLEIYGGFNGSEDLLSERDIIKNVTFLSGDIDNNDKNIGGDIKIFGNNSFHVVTINSSVLIDGFTITGGKANGAGGSEVLGGGITIHTTKRYEKLSPTISNCIFDNNVATFGGGAIYASGLKNCKIILTITNSLFIANKSQTGGAILNAGIEEGEISTTITNCTFQNNSADVSGGAIFNNVGNKGSCNTTIQNCVFVDNFSFIGGAIYNMSQTIDTCKTSISNCNFNNNRAENAGGIFNSVSNGMCLNFLTNCIFENNQASKFGGALYNLASKKGTILSNLTNCIFNNNKSSNASGGAIANDIKDAKLYELIVGCLFRKNYAYAGGAIQNMNTLNGKISSETLNCIFTNNSANIGGAVFNASSSGNQNDISVINCTFFANSANIKGGAIANTRLDNGLCNPNIINCIFWKNTGVDRDVSNVSSNPNISYTLLSESNCPLGCKCTEGIIFGKNPLFVDADNGNFNLQSSSPVIDAGKNSALPDSMKFDYFGNHRFNNNSTNGVAVVDLGAIEYVYKGLENIGVKSEYQGTRINSNILEGIWKMSHAGKPVEMYLILYNLKAIEEFNTCSWLILFNNEAEKYYKKEENCYMEFTHQENNPMFEIFNEYFKKIKIKEGFTQDKIFILIPTESVIGKLSNEVLLYEKWSFGEVQRAIGKN